MYFEESGNKNGKLIIFLHGVGSSGKMWADHFENMQDFHCVAPDLPGHGRSNHFPWTNLDDVVRQIYDLARKFQCESVNLVGLSLGGSLVINFLSKYGKIVDNAIVDGAGIFPVRGKSLIELGVKAVSPFLKLSYVNKALAEAVGIKKDKYESFKKDMVAVHPYSFRTAFCNANDQTEPPDLDKVLVKTLFVAGENEPLATKKSNMYLAKKMVNASSYLLPNEGHGWLAKMPELHVQMTRAWLEGRKVPFPLKKNG